MNTIWHFLTKWQKYRISVNPQLTSSRTNAKEKMIFFSIVSYTSTLKIGSGIQPNQVPLGLLFLTTSLRIERQ